MNTLLFACLVASFWILPLATMETVDVTLTTSNISTESDDALSATYINENDVKIALKQKIENQLLKCEKVKEVSAFLSQNLQSEIEEIFRDSEDVLRRFSLKNPQYVSNNQALQFCNKRFNINDTINEGIFRITSCRRRIHPRPLNLTNIISEELTLLKRNIQNLSVFIHHVEGNVGQEEFMAWDYNEGFKKRRNFQVVLNKMYKKLFLNLLSALEKMNQANRCCTLNVERTKKLLLTAQNKYQVCLIINGSNNDLVDYEPFVDYFEY